MLVSINGVSYDINAISYWYLANIPTPRGVLYRILYKMVGGSLLREDFKTGQERQAKLDLLHKAKKSTETEIDDVPTKGSKNAVSSGGTYDALQDLSLRIDELQYVQFKFVQVKPEKPEPDIIYFVPSTDPNKRSVYDEFVFINDTWEQIGGTTIDSAVIDDTKISTKTTYSSQKIESLSGVKVLDGTEDNPIIIDSLPVGIYVLSGVAQSSLENTTTTTLTKKIYNLLKEDTQNILWDENPYTKTQKYILFYRTGTNEPLIGVQTIATEDAMEQILKAATIDGGNWS